MRRLVETKARPFTVYGWQGHRYDCPGTRGLTREIVAARSMEEAARLAGYERPAQMSNLCETRNPDESAQALSAPGTVFWSPLEWGQDDLWTAAAPKPPDLRGEPLPPVPRASTPERQQILNHYNPESHDFSAMEHGAIKTLSVWEFACRFGFEEEEVLEELRKHGLWP